MEVSVVREGLVVLLTAFGRVVVAAHVVGVVVAVVVAAHVVGVVVAVVGAAVVVPVDGTVV